MNDGRGQAIVHASCMNPKWLLSAPLYCLWSCNTAQSKLDYVFLEGCHQAKSRTCVQHSYIAKVLKLEQDRERKQTVAYKQQKVFTQKLHHHDYGPESQQDDVTPTELLQLCQEFYNRELKVSNDKCNYIKQNRRHQPEDSLWHQQRNCVLQHWILAELQSTISPHLSATLSVLCCTPKPSPLRSHDMVQCTKMWQNSGIWCTWGQWIMPTLLWRIWD